MYAHGGRKDFLPFNVVCLGVRKIAGAQRWFTDVMPVHACVCETTHTQTNTRTPTPTPTNLPAV